MSTRVCASENDGGRVKANDCQLNRISYLFSFVCVCVCFSSSLLCNEQKAYGTFNGYTLGEFLETRNRDLNPIWISKSDICVSRTNQDINIAI